MTRQAKWLKSHPFYMSLWRLANRDKINNQQKARYNKVLRHKRYSDSSTVNREIVLSLKQSPCVDCGGKYPPFIMHFDHRDPSTKKYAISKMHSASQNFTFRRNKKKCDLVQANRHGLRTWKGIQEGKITIFGGLLGISCYTCQRMTGRYCDEMLT